jgi:hypothetical protein
VVVVVGDTEVVVVVVPEVEVVVEALLGDVVVVVEALLVLDVTEDVVLVVVVPAFVVVLVVGEGDAGWLTSPKGPLSPGPACGVLKGLVGLPGWLTPKASTRTKAVAPRLAAPSDPKAIGRAAATIRSRRDSVRRRSSSSGERCSCWSNHAISGAEA